jgi:hypothetical protein
MLLFHDAAITETYSHYDSIINWQGKVGGMRIGEETGVLEENLL